MIEISNICMHDSMVTLFTTLVIVIRNSSVSVGCIYGCVLVVSWLCKVCFIAIQSTLFSTAWCATEYRAHFSLLNVITLLQRNVD